MNNSHKVIFNTISLYVKMIVTTIIALYLTKVVLKELGDSDFGLYNLIGGVVAILSFLNSALMTSTQRFLSVGLGNKDNLVLKEVFQSSLIIHFFLALAVLFLLELCTLFIFDGFLNIDAERIGAAKIVYHLMAFSTVLTILTVPYNAAINAHEHLWYFAIVEILTKVAQLAVVFLFECLAHDSLVVYTGWIVIVTVANVLLKVIWCIVFYDECKLRQTPLISKSRLKEMLGFVGWNTLGSLAMVGRNQGVAVVLNLFFGTAINAAYGVANQVNAQLVYFSQMMTTSMAPQIMKSYGEGNMERMLRLSVLTSKMAFLLSAVFALPLILNLEFVLGLWLDSIPENTLVFCNLIIYVFLAMQLYPGLVRAIQAKGDIKVYQIVLSGLLLLPLPIGYIAFSKGYSCESICYAMIIAQIFTLLATMMIAKTKVGLKISQYIAFVFKACIIYILVYFVGAKLKWWIDNAFSETISLTICIILLPILFILLYYFMVFDKQEKVQIMNIISRKIK